MNKNSEKEKYVKALFSQRLVAFILDCFIISVISVLITSFVPINDAAVKLNKEQEQVLTDYTSGKLDMDEYVNQMIDISYDISRQTVIISILSIAFSLCYYVIYPIYNNGQTIGKKLLKIKIVKINSEELTMNDLLIRSMINNSILYNIINIMLVLFLSKDIYLGASTLFCGTQYLVDIISLFMIAFGSKKQGIHDKVAHTVVVCSNCVQNKEEEEVCVN